MKRERIEKQSRKSKEREEKQLVKERRAKEAVKKETVSKRNTSSLVCQFVELQLISDGSSSEAEDTVCPKCGLYMLIVMVYGSVAMGVTSGLI